MKYYFIGIKGTGMSALATIMHDLGNTVIGYDQIPSWTPPKNGIVLIWIPNR